MSEEKLKSITTNTSPAIKLAAEIGTEMQVEITNLESRVKLTLIGVVPGQYLILRIPEKLFQSSGSAAFKTGSSLNIRSISRGSAFGFHSSIIGFHQTPDTLLYAKYPEKIQQHTIRKNQRVKCLLPAKLMYESIQIAGITADISRSGCHFQAKKDFSSEQVKLTQSGEKITLALSMPGMEADKKITAIIKNTFIDSEKAQMGIEFIAVDESTLKSLDEFIAMSFDLPPF